METNLGVGLLVGLATSSSIYIWKTNDFNKTQKTFLLLFVLFPPLQWVSLFLVLIYNKYEKEKTPEFIKESKINYTQNSLAELRKKGILTEEEFKLKIKKIENEKSKILLANSIEYKQLKSLFESGILTKEEFNDKLIVVETNNNFPQPLTIEESFLGSFLVDGNKYCYLKNNILTLENEEGIIENGMWKIKGNLIEISILNINTFLIDIRFNKEGFQYTNGKTKFYAKRLL